MQKKYLKKFNSANTLAIITTFPQRKGEVALENAISRYSKLLIENFPKNQKIVVICDSHKKGDKPYLFNKNVLVIPSFKKYSFSIAFGILKTIIKFNNIHNFLFQFEFSIYGGKISLPQIALILTILKLMGKNTSFTLHQVVNNLNTLSGHLGLKNNSFRMVTLNILLKIFYIFLGAVCSNLLVHDSKLKHYLSGFIKGDKISIIPHGIGRVSPVSKKEIVKARTRLGIAKGQKSILVFGYYSWYKGTDWIVKAVTKLNNKNVKLILAGGKSPTLKNTASYKKFYLELSSIIKKANGSIISTGFVPENEVPFYFNMADVVVFPYRARMSASGSMSLALSYGKKMLISRIFKENFIDSEFQLILRKSGLNLDEFTFDSNNFNGFNDRLNILFEDKVLENKFKIVGELISVDRNWKKVALQYKQICLAESTAFTPAKANLVYAKA